MRTEEPTHSRDRRLAPCGPAREAGARGGSATSFLSGVAVGTALGYLLGARLGRRRRRQLADRTAARARRASRRAVRAIRVAGARAEGRTRGFLHRLRPCATEPPDDVTLAHKVESVVFRDPAFPKGRVSVNAERGTVFLRGEVDRSELIRDLEAAVRRVPGVRSVENRLHLPPRG